MSIEVIQARGLDAEAYRRAREAALRPRRLRAAEARARGLRGAMERAEREGAAPETVDAYRRDLVENGLYMMRLRAEERAHVRRLHGARGYPLRVRGA